MNKLELGQYLKKETPQPAEVQGLVWRAKRPIFEGFYWKT